MWQISFRRRAADVAAAVKVEHGAVGRNGIHVWPMVVSAGLPESAAAIEGLATFFKAHS